ncbi:hypothetical protein [Pseudoxanthomonas composti]|uniref:Pyruvate carboxyltransferase domain-containing protein n=1 Tax=Pseudoxanthomonas composti TaxID=2137479 RepID=A0A4Q1JYC2_9GAMM|nr:hypothetical protein [Pseudoxanthomonas composti]RXR07143.1 hypothetical protein EPA99_04260 [Pseudoxanthomonas composti]
MQTEPIEPCQATVRRLSRPAMHDSRPIAGPTQDPRRARCEDAPRAAAPAAWNEAFTAEADRAWRPAQADAGHRRMQPAPAGDMAVSAWVVRAHDVVGQAVVQALACLESGVRVVDAAIAGSGGCPYAPGASGHAATEDVVYMLQGSGMETDTDLVARGRAGFRPSQRRGRPGGKAERARGTA